MHRMSLSEIIVPYGDPRAPFNRKCAYDVVDYGMGNCCSSLDLGCDCLGVIKYFDAVLCDKKGTCFAWPLCLPHAKILLSQSQEAKQHHTKMVEKSFQRCS